MFWGKRESGVGWRGKVRGRREGVGREGATRRKWLEEKSWGRAEGKWEARTRARCRVSHAWVMPALRSLVIGQNGEGEAWPRPTHDIPNLITHRHLDLHHHRLVCLSVCLSSMHSPHSPTHQPVSILFSLYNLIQFFLCQSFLYTLSTFYCIPARLFVWVCIFFLYILLHSSLLFTQPLPLLKS